MKQVRRQTVPLKNFQYDALMRNYNQLLKFSALPWNGAGCSPNMVILKIIWNFTMIVPFAKIRDLFSPKRRMDLVRWKNVPAFVKQQWIFCILSPTYGIY